MIDDRELSLAGAALHNRFGATLAARFGHELPKRVAAIAASWALRVEAILDSGATAVVLAVTAADGKPCVLKLSPDAPFLERQVSMLEHLDGTERVPRVLRSTQGAALMERVTPGTPLRGGDDLPTAHGWALLLRDLHGSEPGGVPDTLSARCEEMLARIGDRRSMPAVRGLVPEGTWSAVVRLCRDLSGAGEDEAVIHGDLHLGNVLKSSQRGLVAIDPKLRVGDRCFDMVDFVIARGDPGEMSGRARDLAVLASVDADRLLAWSAVNAVVTAVSRRWRHGAERRGHELVSFAVATIEADRWRAGHVPKGTPRDMSLPTQ
ncbi:MAG: aminoglycoside phosphotransferase family protein [Cellulomonadaceae bacterium]